MNSVEIRIEEKCLENSIIEEQRREEIEVQSTDHYLIKTEVKHEEIGDSNSIFSEKTVPLNDDNINQELQINTINKEDPSQLADSELCIRESSPEITDNILNLWGIQNIADTYKKPYEEYLNKVIKLSVPITESVNLVNISGFKDYTTKFYTDKYCVDFNLEKSSEICPDILVRVHTNGLFLIALAPGNTIMQSNKAVVDISFEINNIDRSKIQIKGKKKMGAFQVKRETALCRVKLEGDDKYINIRAGVKGRLLEFNKEIMTNPNIIKTQPKGLGYICIILPSSPDIIKTLANLNLYDEKEYFDYISKRSKGYWKNF